jgi:hypothetical protein
VLHLLIQQEEIVMYNVLLWKKKGKNKRKPALCDAIIHDRSNNGSDPSVPRNTPLLHIQFNGISQHTWLDRLVVEN